MVRNTKRTEFTDPNLNYQRKLSEPWFSIQGEAMRDLNFGLKHLCRANRDGSYRTQADRERTLAQIADQLHALGHRNYGYMD